MLLDIVERKQKLNDTLSLADRVLTHSEIVKQLVSRIIDVQIEIIRNGQALPWLGEKIERVGSRIIRFGYIGQLEEIKGVHILLQAFERASLNGKANLNIWGDLTRNEAYSTNLRTISNGASSVNFRGRFMRDYLFSVLSQIDILVVPSIWYENSPLVIQEAFSAGIPVIATNLGGMAEAVTHDVNGLLFERYDVADLAKQMKRVVYEPGLLEKLRSGIPEVKSVESEVEELERIYLNLVNKATGDIRQ